jgi:alkanesulfonate monooxygenase SsuD/methylene tetrahydromethanopterin reductase-like flavin-dependent oxidoreductase (luciferase family)
MTDILLGPTYEPVTLAKMAASADQLTDGRLVLGAAASSSSPPEYPTARAPSGARRRGSPRPGSTS